jgi:uncharacterized membrane protein
LLSLAAALYLVQRGNSFVAMLLPVMLLIAYLTYRELRLQRPDAGIRLFVLALVGLGLGLSMGVDLVTLKGDIQRMNTVFKFYLHIWVVFAIAAAFVTWHLSFVTWRPSLSLSGSPVRRIATSGAVASAVLLLFGALLYPLFATPPRLDERFGAPHRGLDGMAYLQDAVYQDEHGPIDLSRDYEGIQWLRQNVQGTPVIVEGRAPLYRWGSRFSIYTGLPTVIGWDWHQTQQRGELAFMVAQRMKDVDAFYSAESVAEAQSFLRVYDVSYVVVGGLERNYYPARGLAKFETGLGGVLDVAYANGGLTIYRVDESALTPALAGLP